MLCVYIKRVFSISLLLVTFTSVSYGLFFVAPHPPLTTRTNMKQGVCTRVIDGDTVTIRVDGRERRVRLHGVDAPEKGQPFFTAARTYVAEKILGRTVMLIHTRKDGAAWNRDEAILFCENNERSINMELLEQGLAVLSREYCRPDIVEKWQAAQNKARTEHTGIWLENNSELPWKKRFEDKYGSVDGLAQRIGINAAYAANGNTGVFHSDNCRYFLYKNSDVFFNARAAAIQCGFRPCTLCTP